MAGNLEEYFRKTFEEKLLIKIPEQEDDHLSPATRLLEKRREMSEVEEALNSQKEEYELKMEVLTQRTEEWEKKELLLKQSVQKFDKFLNENDAKRHRAIKKANDEREMTKVKVTEIARLNEELKLVSKERKRLQEKLNKHIVFYKFLEKTVEMAEEFQEIREIISRYDTLCATHQYLLNKESRSQDMIEQEKAKLKKFTEEKNNEILSCNNQLAELVTRLDKAQSEAVKWESRWMHIKNTAAKKTLLLGRIKMATHNLYQLISKSKKQEFEAQVDDTLEQLNVIQQFIQDLTNITTEIRKADAEGANKVDGSGAAIVGPATT